MSTNAIIGMILAALIVIGGGYYLMNMDEPTDNENATMEETNNEQPETVDEVNTTESGETQSGEYEGTFVELMARGQSLECTIDTSGIPELESGVMYFSGENMRGEFVANAEGYGQMETYMISDGERVHTWSSRMQQGMTMSVEADAQADTPVPQQGFDVDTEYSYDCQEWSVDESYFELPADITFMEMPGY